MNITYKITENYKQSIRIKDIEGKQDLFQKYKVFGSDASFKNALFEKKSFF